MICETWPLKPKRLEGYAETAETGRSIPRCISKQSKKLNQLIACSVRIYERRQADFFEISFFTGLRPGEEMGRQWQEVNLGERTATIQRIIVDRQPADRMKTK